MLQAGACAGSLVQRMIRWLGISDVPANGQQQSNADWNANTDWRTAIALMLVRRGLVFELHQLATKMRSTTAFCISPMRSDMGLCAGNAHGAYIMHEQIPEEI